MKAGIKVMATGGGYTNESVMIWTPTDKKYNFNVGNGIHRQNITSKQRIYDSNHVFLTHISPSTMADFPNYLLRNKNDFTVVGPQNTTHAILAHRYYIGRRNKTIHVTECTAEQDLCISDGYLTVYPVVLAPVDRQPKVVEQKKPLVQLPMFHPYKRPLGSNNTFKHMMAMGLKPFFDWTVLRGGVLHYDAGTTDITMQDIEQYMVYKLLKLEENNGGNPKEFRPANYKQIKEYLANPFPHQADPKQRPITASREAEYKDFWALESRHYRIITRVSNLPPVTEEMRRKIVKARCDMFLSDRTYGPIKSQSHAFVDNVRDETTGMGDVVCYVCHLPDIIGKFDNKKADQLGVPNGPLRTKLCKGQEVVTATGAVVKPEDVLSPSTIGPAVMILACPTIQYLANLLASPTIAKYRDSGRSGTAVHMVPETIFQRIDYIAFVNSFPANWSHIVLNDQCSYHELTVKSGQLCNGLTAIAPTFYPALYPHQPATPLPQGLLANDNESRIQRGRFNQSITLNPLPLSQCPPIDNDGCTEDTDLSFSFATKSPSTSSPATQSPINPKHQLVEQMIANLSSTELEVVFLGTGCSQASLHRDESCIFLDMFDKGSMMFDVGGGSYSQMYRKYGRDECTKKLAGLKFIYLSHLHTDHHQGLFKIVEMRHRAMDLLGVPEDQRTLCILSPPNGMYYMLDIERSLTLERNQWSYIKYFSSNVHGDNANPDLSEFMRKSLDITSVYTIPVLHNFAATGIVVKSQSGWSVGYSGDTTFCQALVDQARDLTILIHEATFQDCMADKAKAKSHSTFSDAIRTAAASNAYLTILTHFSQRYPGILAPTSSDSNDEVAPQIALAFDFLTVNLKHLQQLPNALASLSIDPDEDELVDLDDME
eukprot:gene17952-21417_t